MTAAEHLDSDARTKRMWLIVLAIIAVATIGDLSFYWPGYMIADSIDQMMQAKTGHYSDWHPPLYAWIWRQLMWIDRGPAIVLVLQLTLYWGAFALLAAAAARRGRQMLGVALVACALEPVVVTIMGWVVKDALMTALLALSVALYAWVLAGGSRRLLWLAAGCLFIAAGLRFNAFIAAVPLGLAFLPEPWRRSLPRLALTTLIATAAFAAVGPVVTAALQPRETGVERSLILFDLGGITEYSDVDVLPPIPGLPDVRAENHRCYTPIEWDNYAWGFDPPCKISPASFKAGLDTSGQSAYRIWLNAVLAHPLAYAEHRLGYYNRNLRWFVLRGVNKRAYTPFGWPILFVAIGLGSLILSWRRPSQAFVYPVALSGLAYSLGYLAVGVASDLRYNLWTILSALTAATVSLDDFIHRRGDGLRLLRAVLPAVFVLSTATLWRLFAWLVLKQ